MNIDKHKEGTPPNMTKCAKALTEAYERVRWMIEAAGELYDALNAVMPIVLMHEPTSEGRAEGGSGVETCEERQKMNKHRKKYVESHRERFCATASKMRSTIIMHERSDCKN